MNAPVAAPPKTPLSTYSDEEHAAVWRHYIRDGLSAEQTAKALAQDFPRGPRTHTKNTVVTYAKRQGWAHASAGGTVNLNNVTTAEKPRRAAPKAGPLSCTLADADPVIGSHVVAGVEVDERRASCRFPVGPSPRFHMADQLFCGEAQHPALTPYCRRCAGIAFGATVTRRLEAYAEKTGSR